MKKIKFVFLRFGTKIVLSLFVLVSSMFTFSVITYMTSCSEQDTQQVIVNNDEELEYRDIGESCIRKFSNLPTCNEYTETLDITLPQYPGCTFNISYDYVLCISEDDVAYHFGDFVVNDYDCPKYKKDILKAHAWGKMDSLELVFNRSVWKALTDILISDPPPFVDEYFTVTYNIKSCTKTCYVEHLRGKYELIIIGEKLNCGHKCCKLVTEYELIDGKLVKISEYFETPDGPCDDSTNPNCPIGTIFSTDCSVHCNELLFDN